MASFIHLVPRVVHNFPKAMTYRISCLFAQKVSQIPIEKGGTIDGSTLPQHRNS